MNSPHKIKIQIGL